MTQVHQKLPYCLASNRRVADSRALRADDCSGCSFGPSGMDIPATGNILRAPDKYSYQKSVPSFFLLEPATVWSSLRNP